MNRDELTLLLIKACSAYPNNAPNFDENPQIFETWAEMLEDVKPEQAIKNLNKHIKTSAFFPTIADIAKPEPQEYWIPDMPSLAERKAQELERLEWKEKAVDMPDWIREKWLKK